MITPSQYQETIEKYYRIADGTDKELLFPLVETVDVYKFRLSDYSTSENFVVVGKMNSRGEFFPNKPSRYNVASLSNISVYYPGFFIKSTNPEDFIKVEEFKGYKHITFDDVYEVEYPEKIYYYSAVIGLIPKQPSNTFDKSFIFYDQYLP